jgi:hypothetical protein
MITGLVIAVLPKVGVTDGRNSFLSTKANAKFDCL